MWLVYSQTASATTSGASGSILRKIWMPRAWPSMKPCFFSASYAWPREIRAPSSPNALSTAFSRACWAGQQRWFAERRESPLATRTTCFEPGLAELVALMSDYFSSGKVGFSIGFPPM
jgi:hypothetical protein